MTQDTKVVRFYEFGDADVLRLESIPLEQPGKGEVRIAMRAIGLNRADVLFRQGKYVWTPEMPARIGVEGAGIVEAVGPGGDASLIGKRVLCLPNFSPNDYGVYGETAIVPDDCIAEFPDSLSFENAAACLVPFMTGWGALIHFGALEQGDVVLLTAASSSTGVAAIQLIKAAGATAIVTTRTSAKKQALLDAGADHVIVTGEEDLIARVEEITGGAGARIIYDPVAGDTVEGLVHCLARGGTLFVYGMLSDAPTTLPMLDSFRKYLTLKVYDMHQVIEDPALLRRGLDHIYAGFESGALTPMIDRVFPLDRIVDAHRHIEGNEQIGKIVVSVPQQGGEDDE